MRTPQPRRRQWLRLCLLFCLLLALAVAFQYRDRLDVQAIDAWLQGAGPGGVIAFIALYAVAAVLFLPGSVLTIAGGALFGPVLGTLYNLTGATLGAVLAFAASRYLFGDRLLRKGGDRLRRLTEGVEAGGWRFVAFVRLVPLFPFNLSNYALGLTRIPLPAYALASFFGMMPGAFAYTWLGHAGRRVLEGPGEETIGTALLAVGLVAAALFLPRLIRRTRGG